MLRSREFSDGGTPPWMLIFTDMMTLILTFLIILVSMSAIDEQSRQDAIESVRGVFGVEDKIFNFDSPLGAEGMSSGAQSTRPGDREQEARQLLFADNQNITLRTSPGHVFLEIAGDMLFTPGGISISANGRSALDRLVPLLLQASYPVTISGHGSPGYSEGVKTDLSSERLVDSSWPLSMERSLAVYRHFVSRGVEQNILRLENFGSHHPEYDNKTSQGRRMNRRVDIAIDRRDAAIAAGVLRQSAAPAKEDYIFRDFHFNLDLTPPAGATGGL